MRNRKEEVKMAVTSPICDICGTKKSTSWMTGGGYQTCSKCSKDITLFELQPMKDHNLKMLLEVFNRRGKGEDVTFEKIHKEKASFKLITFDELWENNNDVNVALDESGGKK